MYLYHVNPINTRSKSLHLPQMATRSALAFLLAAASVLAGSGADAAIAGLEIRHRFSDRMREWADAHGVAGERWPEKHTPKYYASLALHDRGRQLAGAANFSELGLANGNITFFDFNLASYALVMNLLTKFIFNFTVNIKLNLINRINLRFIIINLGCTTRW